MLRTLLGLRLRALLSVLTGASRTKKKQSTLRLVGFTALMLYALGSIVFLFWHIFDVLAGPFAKFGLGGVYFTLAALLAFVLMIVGGIFTAKSQLFEARDNELLLSLPIRPMDILLSRLCLLWLLAAIMGLPLAVPCLLVWPRVLSGRGYAAFVAIFLILLPFLCVAVSSFLGWVVHRISALFGHKPIITVLLWMLLIGGYFYLSVRMGDILDNLAENPLQLLGIFQKLGPVLLLGQAIALGDLAALGKLALAIVPLFAVVCLLLAKTFVRTATDRRGMAKKHYVERSWRVHSPRTALLQRELRRLWTCPAYLFNSGMGVVLALIAAVALLVKGGAVRGFLAQLPEELAQLLSLLAIPTLCFMASMIFLTGPSISLEGKTLWLLKSLPVDTRTALNAKLRLQLWVALPPILLLSAAVALVLRPGCLLLALVILLPALYCLLIGLVGLVMNLRFPNFDWVNETQAVKSGASVLLTMFIGMAASAAPMLVYVLTKGEVSAEWIGGGTAVLALLGCLLLYRWLMRRGVEIFQTL